MRSLDGMTLGGYRLIEQVGVGGMAVIYKAYDPGLDRYVAIKLLPEYLGHGEEFSARFRNEARNVARLHHPNILPIYGYGEEEGLSYFVMGLVEGGTLKDMMGEPMPPERAVSLIVQLADALQYAHEQGIVHRDVKPANVLMSRSDWPLLSDFGIARVLEQKAALTHSAFLGTPHYMAPEQARGEPVSPKTDQYALGIVLYEALTGTPPFQADTPQAVVYQHIYASLPLPHLRNPNISEPVERVILKALAKVPADRFPDMAAFARAVRDALEGRVAAPAQPLPSQAGPTSETQEPFPPDRAATAYEPLASSSPAAQPGPFTERIETPPMTPAVRPVQPTEEVTAGKPPRGPLFPLSKPVLLGAGGVAVLALVAFAVVRASGSGSGKGILKLTVRSGSVPALTVRDQNDNDVADVTAENARTGVSVPYGKYILDFWIESGYNGKLPIVINSDTTLDLSSQMSFMRIAPAPDLPLQGVEVDNSAGQYQFNLPTDNLTKTQAVPPGSYLLNLNSNNGYLDPVPLQAAAGRHAVLKLTGIFARMTVVPPSGRSLVDLVIRDQKASSYYHSVPALQAQQGVYLRPGRYSLDFSGSNTYLDPMPVNLHAGSQSIHLAKYFGLLKVIPIPHAGVTAFALQNPTGTTNIHDGIATKDAEAGIYLRPGKYSLLPSSTLFMSPIPVNIQAQKQVALTLERAYGDLIVAAAPGAGLSSLEVDDAKGTSIHTFYDKDAKQHIYLRPGRYVLKLSAVSSSSNSYVDPATYTAVAGSAERVNLGTVFAGIRVPVAPGGQSVSYSWTDRLDKTTKTANAGTKPAIQYVLPGTYHVEVTNGGVSRLIAIQAPAGKTVTLPTK